MGAVMKSAKACRPPGVVIIRQMDSEETIRGVDFESVLAERGRERVGEEVGADRQRVCSPHPGHRVECVSDLNVEVWAAELLQKAHTGLFMICSKRHKIHPAGEEGDFLLLPCGRCETSEKGECTAGKRS
jgi:hypothetical protein